jgi:hypothetical protein
MAAIPESVSGALGISPHFFKIVFDQGKLTT